MRICLNVIVKNESAAIARCLHSVLPHIHAWAIVDTGSTDGSHASNSSHIRALGAPSPQYQLATAVSSRASLPIESVQ
jgi:hypothetical protein